MISCAAIAIACSPDEQKRFTVTPRDRDRQLRQHGHAPGNVLPLRTMGLGAAEKHVLDLSRIQAAVFFAKCPSCNARPDPLAGSC